MEMPPPKRLAAAPYMRSSLPQADALRTAGAGAPHRAYEALHFPMRLPHECYEAAGAQLPPNVAWAPVAELPPFQEQLLRAANTPRDLRQGAFALGLTRSVCKSLSEASTPLPATNTS